MPDEISQLIVVNSADGFRAKLSYYERGAKGWERIAGGIDVVIGRNGLGKRKEGDGKTPVGLFSFGDVYGYSDIETKMPFFISDKSLICVDDVNSRYYNRIVDSSRIKRDFKSFEYMRRDDDLYEIVVTVGYNSKNVPSKGSCIFLHVTKGEKPTAGCIAMRREDILKLVEWLDPKKRPTILVGNGQ
ncbi:MAG: L,D-transpeptidase family protein [Hydrogenimonas sp.]|nr:L,D-transpeptidase family protein [Hydrogenimonas sp.]